MVWRCLDVWGGFSDSWVFRFVAGWYNIGVLGGLLGLLGFAVWWYLWLIIGVGGWVADLWV